MNTLTSNITPPLSADRASEIAQSLDLRALPADFLNNPYPVYAALRETETRAEETREAHFAAGDYTVVLGQSATDSGARAALTLPARRLD